MRGVTTIELTHANPELLYEYARYLQLHGPPEDGFFKAELLAEYRQEKLDLGYDIDF